MGGFVSIHMVGCGVLLQGEDGQGIRGYSKALGSTTAYVIELWGLLEGLKMTRRMIKKW